MDGRRRYGHGAGAWCAFSRCRGQVLAANGGNLARVASIEMVNAIRVWRTAILKSHVMLIIAGRGTRRGGGVRPAKRGNAGMVEELEQGLQNYARVLQQQMKSTSVRWRAAARRAVWVLRGGIPQCGY